MTLNKLKTNRERQYSLSPEYFEPKDKYFGHFDQRIYNYDRKWWFVIITSCRKLYLYLYAWIYVYCIYNCSVIIYNKNAKVAVFVGNSVCFICCYKGNSNVKIQTLSKVKHLIYLSRHIVLNTNNIQINQIGYRE